MRRFHYESGYWHVFARGARRMQLFRDDQDFLQFLTFLSYALNISGCTVWAYALMTNHYHLVLNGSSVQLTACMRRLMTMYSRYHNSKYGMEGHSFDAPYHAYRQPTLLLLLHCIAYVLFNPVKGGLCATPEAYPWSCARNYLGLPGSPLDVHPGRLIQEVDPDPSIGWARFHEAMACEARRPQKSPTSRLTMTEVHIQQFEWLLQFARQHPERLQGEDPIAVAMYWGRQCGISPRAIAASLPEQNSAAVRQTIRRFTARIEKDPILKSQLFPP